MHGEDEARRESAAASSPTTHRIDTVTGGRRMRRLRQADWSRRLVRETEVSAADLIWPIFVREGDGEPEPVPSMPGVFRHSVDAAAEVARPGRATSASRSSRCFPTPTRRSATRPGRRR